ncbi:CLUMA_CG004889, isoform A [Clunio marinus]|uniref:CLUMA_CG004889, isoform A n=1 Tax=Clunio marinus TaxID=568069 RepID=A0A1J1HXF5_9DIPT|nr:CLUMA_CG004889, isoform A [Clunio marinus]
MEKQEVSQKTPNKTQVDDLSEKLSIAVKLSVSPKENYESQNILNTTRKPPGLAKRILLSVDHTKNEGLNHSYQESNQKKSTFDDELRFLGEFSSPQEQQHFQQQKLLEFQQQNKLQQVEKVLPLDNFGDFNSQHSSATFIGQQLALLKQMQQKQQYENLLRQQYENRDIIEEFNNAENFPTSFDNECSSQCYSEELTLPSNVIIVDDDNNLESNHQLTTSSPPEICENMLNLKDKLRTKFSESESDAENGNAYSTSEVESHQRNDEFEEQVSCLNRQSKGENDEKAELETDQLLGQEEINEIPNGSCKENLTKIECANGKIILQSKTIVNKTPTFIRQGNGIQMIYPVEKSKDEGISKKFTIASFIKDKSNSKEFSITSADSFENNKKGMKIVYYLKKNHRLSHVLLAPLLDLDVLVEGVVFRTRYLGSTQLFCEGKPTKSTRLMQAEEAVSRIKAPEGESQPSVEVELFISAEKVMVLNSDLKEIMMDHELKSISYIADIGNLVVLMARRKLPQTIPSNNDDVVGNTKQRKPKLICHIFESSEAQIIAQSIGQAFQVAYMEFLKANGVEDHSFMKELNYQEVLNSQELLCDELDHFSKKELQKEVVVPKAKGEILGVVIVESGWGSMLPTVVIANLASNGAAARCGQLNIGDQIIAINGLSLVGLPLSQCQSFIKNTKNQTVVKFTIVPCAPVVEVKIKRPNTKYQLGFSVQNGAICSLLRGGIAERGGIRVGHRIIEINNQSVVAVPHEKIVTLLATSVGEISMKTMPTSMFRLLTGQENPTFI